MRINSRSYELKNTKRGQREKLNYIGRKGMKKNKYKIIKKKSKKNLPIQDTSDCKQRDCHRNRISAFPLLVKP